MSELISNSTRIIPPPEPGVTAAAANASAGLTIGGFTLDATVFIIGSILMLMIGYYVFLFIFGQPVAVAKEAASGGSIVQHFNTPKSAIMKVAKVSGGAFQYKNVRDGTVATTPESVTNIKGRQFVFTFAQLGLTLSPRLLAGISILVHQGINNLEELRAQHFTKIVPSKKVNDGEKDILVPTGTPYWELQDDKTIIDGYNFDDFNALMKQSSEEKLIPLTIEAVPAFINKNVNADYTEKKLTIMRQLYSYDNPGSGTGQLLGIAIAIALLIMASTVIK